MKDEGPPVSMKRTALLDNGHVRLKPCRYGFMLYLVADQGIGRSLDRYGEFSEGEVELFRQLIQPGWTILEVGANLGAHTVFLAKATGPRGAVYAFEPRRTVFQMLCANVALNALGNVHARQVAVGRAAAAMTAARPDHAAASVPPAAGSVIFVMPPPGGYSADDRLDPALPTGDRLPVIAIDSLDLPACDFIKVDAEGMEGDAIAGAEQTLRRFRPLLYVENSRQEKSASLIRQLLALDYRLYWHLPPLVNPQNYFEAGENIFAGSVSIHMLGIHASVSQTVTGFREITGPQDSWPRAVGSGPHDVPAAGSQQALELKQDDAEAHYALGIALHDQGKLDEAIACYRRAVELKPDNAGALNNLGVALAAQGQLDEAITCYRQALQRKPDYAEAHNNLGNALKTQGCPDEAIACYRQALQCMPDYAEAHHNLGVAFQEQGELEEAMACCRRALHLKPDFAGALAALVHQLQRLCLWQDLAVLSQQMIAVVEKHGASGIADVFLPFYLLQLSTPTTAAQQLLGTRNWVDRRLRSAINYGRQMGLPRPRRGKARITLGYLSADFHAHATAYLIAELLEKHDRDRFEVFGYSYGIDDGSSMRRRLVNTFDRFADLKDASFTESAQRIAADEVDILVDLKGYTGGARPQIVAMRPAPVQVNYLGYPGTMGAPFVDYILVDEFVVPPDQKRFFTEKVVYLPGCYQVNDSRREISAHTPSRAECGLPEEGFVFCGFNNTYKITAKMFALWMELLKAVPGSVLWLFEGNRFAPANLRREAEARQVAAQRLVFAPRVPLPEHLARHRVADLFLDTFPVNAHTTASDALWAGCPVLTMAGETFVSRVAGSLLRTIGLSELVTSSLGEYQATALRLAREENLLGDLRARLEANRKTARLFDAGQFARNLEKAYVAMWEIYASGQQPHAFTVSAT
jgi:FkbM family methyltransferase